MNYCSECGNSVTEQIPEGDNRLRFVCIQCEVVHYQNPKVVTGCLPFHEDKVLLCKRAIAPRSGYWTLPAGFLENGETAAEGALRETMEEANANAEVLDLYTLFSLPHISQIYMFYRARLIDLDFHPGIESLDTRLFSESEIPWQELAFPVITETLKHYFSDLPANHFPTRSQDILIDRKRDPVR
ncbi:MAG: NUDIX hydrolase [Pseudomonadales bacterium]|nr:NUDIX hydrolase [Pseudomonadales bacterium]MBO6566855.1 NUDIX hydrolase [Pseudomonadales bacterium]MBO6596335.1 NUDIX hydrolase [Pseudomonadales bacterium]MBO6658708.1 NUDIX hydrolase [Pseudomonadales bacterium]MBO6702946.1 NUDIX hydrolase [Pseudomonadales bacterium]